MFRFLMICGCLLAVANAGVIGGGLLAATGPALAVQPAAVPLSAALALPALSTSTSNVIRGIGISAPLTTTTLGGHGTILAPGIAGAPAITNGLVAGPLGLHGLTLNGLGLGLGALRVL